MMRRTLKELEGTISRLASQELLMTPETIDSLKSDLLTYSSEDFSFSLTNKIQRMFIYRDSLSPDILDLINNINERHIHSSTPGPTLTDQTKLDFEFEIVEGELQNTHTTQTPKFNRYRYNAFNLKLKALDLVNFRVKNAITSEWVLSSLASLGPLRNEMALFKTRQLPILYMQYFNICAKFNFDIMAFLNDTELPEAIDAICQYLEALPQLQDSTTQDEDQTNIIKQDLSKIIKFVFGCHLLDFRTREYLQANPDPSTLHTFNKLYSSILRMSLSLPLFATPFITGNMSTLNKQ